MAMNGNIRTILKLASAIVSLAALIGVAFTVDQRYVNAEEFKKQIFTVKSDIRDLHRARIEDEIFKLELIPLAKRTQAEKAMLDRYRSQLKEIDGRREKEAR